MHYIKDIFEKNITEHAHKKFIRYSKGTFVGPLAKIKITKSTLKISASFHYTDELLEIFGNYVGDKEMHVKGFLIWNTDLSDKLLSIGIKYPKVTKSRGIFKYTLDNEIKVKSFIKLFNNYNLLITIKSNDCSLVTKTAFPKPNKVFSYDFCKVTLPAEETKDIVLSEFAFDIEPTKDILISHEIIIDKIDIPKADTFDEARRLAKRIGTLKRVINGKTSEIKINV